MFSSSRFLRSNVSRVAAVATNHSGKMFMKQAALMSSNIVKSPFGAEKLSHPSAQVPIANFILKDFLKEDRKDLVSIVDGFSGKELTFTQVYYYTLSLTNSFKKLGFGPGDCIALVSPNHLHYMTSFLAISLTGAVSTCANPLYSESEFTYQFEKTKSKAVVTHPMCLEKILKVTPVGQKVIIMDDGIDCKNNEGIQKLIKAFAKSEVLYMSDLMSPTPFADAASHLEYDKNSFNVDQVLTIPFSSGTTGRSKGVLLTHKNLISNIVQADDYEDKSHRRIVVVPLPFFHIYGNTLGVLLSHQTGGKIIFMPAFDMIKFLEIVQNYKVTRAFLVPPIILALAKHPIVDKYDLSTLTEVNSGAAPLGVEVQLAAAKRLNCIVKQGFGMTEASPMLASVPKGMMQGAYKDKATSGVMVAGTEGKVIDPLTGEDLPPTSEGELLVRGPQVMKGYLEDPEANARTFTDDGFLRTGDIGFYDETGYLYLTDRAKELIKYKGMQVPPAELEAIIASIPQVKDCIVIPVPDDEAGEIPRAYVVKQDNAPADFNEKSVIDFVATKVAPHKKLRGGVFFTDNIPKAPSGKLLRRVQVEIDRKINPVNK